MTWENLCFAAAALIVMKIITPKAVSIFCKPGMNCDETEKTTTALDRKANFLYVKRPRVIEPLPKEFVCVCVCVCFCKPQFHAKQQKKETPREYIYLFEKPLMHSTALQSESFAPP